MISLLLLYAITQGAFGEAIPISSIEKRDPSGSGELNQTRTLWNIILSCLSTIFLCTWISLHPNISSTSDGPGTRRLDKLRKSLVNFSMHKLPSFLCALLFPEYVFAWAIRQYIMAGEIQSKVPGWTRTHGFFLIMGGFQLYEHPDQEPQKQEGAAVHYSINPGKFVRVLEFADVRDHNLETIIPYTTEGELHDRGKGDGIANATVLLQTSWFVVQCVARSIGHLPLTELEIITLAYITMNATTYFLWWDKPRDVRCPIRVYENVETSHTPEEEWESGFLGRLERILMCILGGQDEFVRLSKESKVPRFWSSAYGDDGEMALGCGLIGLVLLGVALGAAHFTAWWHEFPSYLELILWRISCIALVAIPPFSTVIMCCCGFADLDIALLDVIVCVFFVLSACLYIASRVTTIVIAFTTLRSLPSEALLIVDWTTFIPHI